MFAEPNQAMSMWEWCCICVQGPSMAQGEFPTAFPLKHQRKDLELALSLSHSQSHELPVAAAATKLFKQASLGVSAGYKSMLFQVAVCFLTRACASAGRSRRLW